jgi:hypothetical protein
MAVLLSITLERAIRLGIIIPISLIRCSTLYAGKMAKYKAFILTSKNNQIICEIVIT